MNTLDKCKNCGYDRGLHHYLTTQCPFGGEAPIGRKQEWMTLVFEEEYPPLSARRIATLETENKQLRQSLENCLAILRNVEFIDTGGVVYQARALLDAK